MKITKNKHTGEIKRHRNYNLSNLTEVDTEEASKTELKKVGENVCED